MGLEFKAQDSNNNGYPLQAFGVVGQYEKSAYGSTVAGSASQSRGVIQATYDFADLPAVFTSETGAVATIPAGARIKSAECKVLSTISGGTNFDVGLSQPDGTVVDANGLVASAVGTTGWIIGGGAEIGGTSTNPLQLTVSGTRTAGVIEVTVTYSI